jgi:hypothetical protein
MHKMHINCFECILNTLIFLHIRLVFPLVLPRPEISDYMGVPDKSRALQMQT